MVYIFFANILVAQILKSCIHSKSDKSFCIFHWKLFGVTFYLFFKKSKKYYTMSIIVSRSLKFIWFKIRHFHYFLWNHSGVVRKYITKVFLRYVTFLLLKRDFLKSWRRMYQEEEYRFSVLPLSVYYLPFVTCMPSLVNAGGVEL